MEDAPVLKNSVAVWKEGDWWWGVAISDDGVPYSHLWLANVGTWTKAARMDLVANKLALLLAEANEECELSKLVTAASQRAFEAWRAEHPEERELTWPDLAAHILWAFERATSQAPSQSRR
jgi:hypothetical protein